MKNKDKTYLYFSPNNYISSDYFPKFLDTNSYYWSFSISVRTFKIDSKKIFNKINRYRLTEYSYSMPAFTLCKVKK